MESYIFKLAGNGDFYSCELPGHKLIEAQRNLSERGVTVPMEDGGGVNLSTAEWYDSDHLGDSYHDIKELWFDPDAIYTVRFVKRVDKVKMAVPYLFAVRVPHVNLPQKAS